jgi:hypothetical protein
MSDLNTVLLVCENGGLVSATAGLTRLVSLDAAQNRAARELGLPVWNVGGRGARERGAPPRNEESAALDIRCDGW